MPRSTKIFKRLQQKAEKRRIPLNALFELTHRCNLRCSHCYVDNENHTELTTDGVKKALDILKDNGTFFVIFTGGEAMLRSDIYEILTYAKISGFVTTLFTSGTIIDGNNAERLIKTGTDDYEMSIYSDIPSDHDALTGVDGSFKRTMGAARLLKSLGAKVTLKTVWSKLNFARVKEMYALADKLGCELRGAPYISVTNSGDTAHLNTRCNDDELTELFSSMYELQKERIDETFNEVRSKEYDYETLKDKRICGACVTKLRIDPYGNIYPCVAFGNAMGNITEDDFKSVWSGDSFAKSFCELRVTDIKKCRDCDRFAFCRYCPADSLKECSDMLIPTDEMCRVAKAHRTAFYNTMKKI